MNMILHYYVLENKGFVLKVFLKLLRKKPWVENCKAILINDKWWCT